MLNYQRNRSYNRSTPTSCAFSVFGLGVVLTLAGIVLMVITKNSRNRDERNIESVEEEEGPIFHSNIVKRNKARSDSVNNALKSSGPIVLGTGITIIVLFFLAIIAVAWSKELKASSARSQLPVTSGACPSTASAPGCDQSQLLTSSSSRGLVPKRHSGQTNDKSNLSVNPPSYDEIDVRQRDGECLESHDGILIPEKQV